MTAVSMETRLLIEPTSVFRGMVAFSNEEIGAALFLAMAVANAGGTLIASDRELAAVARCSVVRWRRMAPQVLSVFDRTGNALRPGADPFFSFDARRAGGRPPIPSSVAREVRRRDGDQCFYCRATEGQMHLDHVMPWSRGGEHTADNLVIACRACNLAKGARTIDEWMVI